MPASSLTIRRRRVLQLATGSMSALACATAWPETGKSSLAARPLVVSQIVDMSLSQQDVSKDFLTGSRAAWQEVNARGGLHGRPVQHLALETDGTAAGVRAALDRVKDNPSCIVLSGSAGDALSSQVATHLHQTRAELAHVAPWLQNSSLSIDEQTFPIFAARREQIAHALKTLSVMGLKELGAVYATTNDYSSSHEDVERTAAAMGLKLLSLQGAGNLDTLGQKLTIATPAVLLFLGGTPELAQFTQGLARQARQRYLVALADVNLQTVLQMGALRNTAIIATQPVPLTNSGMPIVRAYREVMARLFDEAPTSLSLAGFIAARYTFETLQSIDGSLTRQRALAAFQRRADTDLGGFRIVFDPQKRSATYVTQSMTTADGRLIG